MGDPFVDAKNLHEGIGEAILDESEGTFFHAQEEESQEVVDSFGGRGALGVVLEDVDEDRTPLAPSDRALELFYLPRI